MGKSRSKSRSEVEYLKGRIRKLEAELKYYKKREHLFDNQPIESVIQDNEIEEVNVSQCPKCKKGLLVSYDLKFIQLKKCDHCSYEKREKQK
jgi:hypothetical protein